MALGTNQFRFHASDWVPPYYRNSDTAIDFNQGLHITFNQDMVMRYKYIGVFNFFFFLEVSKKTCFAKKIKIKTESK